MYSPEEGPCSAAIFSSVLQFAFARRLPLGTYAMAIQYTFIVSTSPTSSAGQLSPDTSLGAATMVGCRPGCTERDMHGQCLPIALGVRDWGLVAAAKVNFMCLSIDWSAAPVAVMALLGAIMLTAFHLQARSMVPRHSCR